MLQTRILNFRQRSTGSCDSCRLTFEAFVRDQRIAERLVVFVHHSFVVSFADDFTRITPTEIVH